MAIFHIDQNNSWYWFILSINNWTLSFNMFLLSCNWVFFYDLIFKYYFLLKFQLSVPSLHLTSPTRLARRRHFSLLQSRTSLAGSSSCWPTTLPPSTCPGSSPAWATALRTLPPPCTWGKSPLIKSGVPWQLSSQLCLRSVSAMANRLHDKTFYWCSG